MKQLLSILCLAFLLVACEKEELNPRQVERPVGELLPSKQSPGLDKKGPPAQSGPYVVRSEESFAFFISDEAAGVTAFLGFDATEAFCHEQIDYDLVPVQYVFAPSGDFRIISRFTGTVRTTVYEGIYTEGDICAFLASAPILAQGYSTVTHRDNDLLVDQQNPNRNAYGWTAHGTLTDPNGDQVQFSWHLSVLWDGVNFEPFKVQTKLTLK